jgi:hypothetical protein
MNENVEYSDVVRAVNELESDGKRPTIAGVRAALGDRGSVTHIAKHLKEWKREKMAKLESDNPQESAPEIISKDNLAPEKIAPTDNNVEDVKVSVQENNPSNKALEKTDNDSSNYSSKEQGEQKKSSGLFRSKSKNTRNKPTGPVDDYAQKSGLKEDYLTSQVDFEPLTTEALTKLDKQALIIKVRQLQSVLTRENNRTETAEKLTREAHDYAQALKEQVGHRINDLKESMTVQITQLRNQMREFKQQSEEDLNYYRKQLEKANSMLAESKLKG